MSDISNRIDNLLTQMQMKRTDLARATNIPVSTIKNWINEGSTPSADAAFKVANYFGITVEWLVTGKNSENKKQDVILSDQENSLIDIYRKLDERDQNALITMAESLLSHYASQDNQESISG